MDASRRAGIIAANFTVSQWQLRLAVLVPNCGTTIILGLPMRDDPIYLDYNATTPLLPEVREQMEA